MSRWPDAMVRSAVGAPAADGPGFTQISSDTRSLEPGALFVALKGERFDGHDYLAGAAAAGARGAVVRRGTQPVAGLELFPVDDPLRALGDLAHTARQRITGPVVAITGTNGKTSTKEMLAAVLRTRYRVHATRANLNNLIGVPTTILQAPADAESMVVEAGANLPGEIARYREIIAPDIAVVTNVGVGHLEGFGSLEGVLREKLSLTAGVPLAVVGLEPAELGEGARRLAARVLRAGLGAADVAPSSVDLDGQGRARVAIDGVVFTLPLPGRHLAANAMLAWALVRELDLDPQAAADALSSVTVPGGRSELQQIGDLTVLNDCYNANPQSFRAAMATAAALRQGRRLVFVAGTMREIGPASAAYHREIAG